MNSLEKEPKQETLEEAVKRLKYTVGNEGISNTDSFIKGAKWQAQRMYDYDELRRIAYNAYCLGQLDEPTESKYNLWIQQFKKQ